MPHTTPERIASSPRVRSLHSIADVEPKKRALSLPIATALRGVLRAGYGKKEARADILAGLVVGIVALPLSMALSIAVGVPPQHGLYTATIAGAAIALLGGCRFQVSGPTAAFIVILAPIVHRYGLGGLLTAGLLAGLMLVAMGVARLGRFISYIPHPVTTGFTTGIGVVIATLQIKDVLGLRIAAPGEHYVEKVSAIASALGTIRPAEAGIAALTLTLLLVVPRFERRVPAPLIALVVSSLVAIGLAKIAPSLQVDTLGSRFSSVVDGVTVQGIPRTPPLPRLPWGEGISYAMVRELLPSAFAIAMLGAIESLLSGVIADGLTNTNHDPDAELVGLGVGNILAPFFGGIAATGALARTATNIRAGAHSPFAAVVHSGVVLASILVLASWVAYVPMAALAALLLLVAWNMSEIHQFVNTLKIAPKSDITVLLVCFSLTVLFDMVLAISVGVVLAAILFMRRMAEMTQSQVLVADAEESDEQMPLPPGVALYVIRGPLFFGAAKSAMSAILAITEEHPKALVISLGTVPTIDATGIVALDSAIQMLLREKIPVVIAGPLPQPVRIFDKARLFEKYGVKLVPHLGEALRVAAAIEPPPRSARA